MTQLLLTEKKLGYPSDKKMHWWAEVAFALDCDDDGIKIYEIMAMLVIVFLKDGWQEMIASSNNELHNVKKLLQCHKKDTETDLWFQM